MSGAANMVSISAITELLCTGVSLPILGSFGILWALTVLLDGHLPLSITIHGEIWGSWAFITGPVQRPTTSMTRLCTQRDIQLKFVLSCIYTTCTMRFNRIPEASEFI
jgi:hypothetical protein